MKANKQIKYVAYFPGRKAPYYQEPDSGGCYIFSYSPNCGDGLRGSKNSVKSYAPHTFGDFEIHTVEVSEVVYDTHLPFSVSRTSKNKWVASCTRCGFSSNGGKSTIQFALDNIRGRSEGTVCSLVDFKDLGVT